MTTDLSETSLWDWDVFLSFRGADTRYKFTDHLYHNLKRKHIRVFRDAEGLRTGDEISPSLVKAIQGSRVSVVIFSGDYASSNSCLDELVTILKCIEERKQRVIPIFYEVDPSKVRYQGMDVHEQKYGEDSEKVQSWRSAMEKASKLKGESYLGSYEYEFIEKIVKQIMSFLGPPRFYVAANPVGLRSRISEFILLSQSVCSDQNDVHMLGIYGISGIGKTTFAKAIYNMVGVQFESACFVEVGVKASTIDGLVRMQETILATVLGEEDIKLRNIHEGTIEMQQRLQNKKILPILDDVDELEQLKKLAGGCNWFGPGSRVIITTRHRDLLRQHRIKNERTYELKPLDHREALELFCWHSFKKSAPKLGYADIADGLTKFAQGLPLALEIIGADLYDKDIDEWESILAAHKSIMSEDIFARLKISYNKLREDMKEMFLDMACFFNGESCDYLEKVFEVCKFYPRSGMTALEDKCFIRRRDGKVWMHELIQKMGREIVKKESKEPNKRSRLWHHKDVLEVLSTRYSGTALIHGLMLEVPEHMVVESDAYCFERMINLRILIIRNAKFSAPPKKLPNSLVVLHWEEYPSSYFPSDFLGNKLVDLRLGNANHPFQLDYPLKKFANMKYLSITRCKHVTEVPTLSCANHLVELHLDFCCNLVKLGDDNASILLPRLQVFSAMGCPKLKACPKIISQVLKTVNLSGCRQIQYVPPMPSEALQELYLQGSGEYIAWSFYSNKEKSCPVVFVPGEYIPSFFQYRRPGNSLSFQVEMRVPTIWVAFSLEPMEDNLKLSYEISLSIGDNLEVFRKGKFISNSCRVFFCNLTNTLTEREKIVRGQWGWPKAVAEVKGIVTLRRPCGDAVSVVVKECGVFVNPLELNLRNRMIIGDYPLHEYLWFKELYGRRQEVDAPVRTAGRRECDVSSRSRIRTMIDEGKRMMFCEFDHDGSTSRSSRTALGLPERGWVKISTAGFRNRDPSFVARDWTGGAIVGLPIYADHDSSSVELSAISKGLEWAQRRGPRNVIVESDSSETLSVLERGVKSTNPSSSVVGKCRYLLKKAAHKRLNLVHLTPAESGKLRTAIKMAAALGTHPSNDVPYFVIDMISRSFSDSKNYKEKTSENEDEDTLEEAGNNGRRFLSLTMLMMTVMMISMLMVLLL